MNQPPNEHPPKATGIWHSQTTRAIRWPTPPFYKPAQPPSTTRSTCALELIDGRVLEGDLVAFEAGGDSIRLHAPGGREITRVAVAEIRSIKLTRPVEYVAETAALTALGVAATPDNAKPFEIAFRDGTKLTGTTLGFVNGKDGLFLFLVEGSSTSAINCFVPAHQIKDVRIGHYLGATLVEKRAISAETLALALKSQAKLREQRIGKYFSDREIVSAEELTRALQEQRMRPNVQLGDVLIEEELINEQQLAEAMAVHASHRERRIGDILVGMGVISRRLIQFALADKLGIPYVNVLEFRIGPGALEAVDPAVAIRHQVLPLLLMDQSLVIAVEDPLDIDFAQDLRFGSSESVVPVIANPVALKSRIAREYASLAGKSSNEASSTSEASLDPRTSSGADLLVADLANQLTKEPTQSSKDAAIDARVSDNTLVRLVNKIIVEAHTQGASDIHVESNIGKSTLIRFRKDGDLENYLNLPQAYANALVSRIKIMADLDISEHRHPQDGKIDFSKHGPLPIELRVAIIPTANNLEDVVLRILGGAEPLPLDRVGFSGRDLEKLKAMIARSYGLILVCGPTGSGKTTTLHSVLREINTPDMKIWTAEDPIEITQPGLRQVQVHSKIDWTFAAAMRAFLRADPDVIMVGEMRDAETTKIGIEASLTGHLVFSTLHTNSAAESVVRLLDLGMDPFNFADALIGIMSQRLARKLCPSCNTARIPSETELADLAVEYCVDTNLEPAAVLSRWRTEFAHDGHVVFREPVGCSACRGGYKGRVVVYELLAGTPEVKHLIRSHGSVPELVAAGQAGGMLTLRQNAIERVLHGVIDLPSARAVSS